MAPPQAQGSAEQKSQANSAAMAPPQAQGSAEKKEPERKSLAEHYLNAVETIMAVNTYFGVAVFLGITNDITPSSDLPVHCIPKNGMSGVLFREEIYSFCFYVLSSVIALGFKFMVSLMPHQTSGVEKRVGVWSMLTVLASGCFSTAGFLYVLWSMFYVIQLKLGLLRCGGWDVLVPAGLLAFIGLCGFVIYVSGGVFLVLFWWRQTGKPSVQG